MEKNYNYQRKKLFLPEYGRHIHEMVDYLSTIEDRDQRNQQAWSVIAVMGNINPMLRDSADFDQKLWDHLFIMSDFQLDVDSPYPIPTRNALTPVPDPLSYPSKHIARKHYGKNIERMILSLKDAGGKEHTEDALANIMRYMRTKLFEYNQEHPTNEQIIKDIRVMSGHTIEVDEDTLNNLKSDYRQYVQNRPKKSGPQNRGGKNVKNVKSGNGKQRHIRPK